MSNTTELQSSQVITDTYNHIDKALEVKDYPYGFRLRTSIFYWIETKKGKGDRFCTRTINPKNGKFNAPKCSTYSPYLYLQTDEKGHITTGTLSAYHVDHFEARFYFVLRNFYPLSLSEDQQYNIRMDYLAHCIGAMPWDKAKYSTDTVQDYINWCQAKVKHIKTCPFDQLVEYPAAPEPDQPDAKREFKIVEHQPNAEPTDPVHTITAEKIEALLKKTLPGFYCAVSEYTIFGTYFKIVISVNSEKRQSVSLSLNVKTLELKPQQYGGSGGQCIYRFPNMEDKAERWLAMKSVKIPYRTPACNEKDVLAAIERFAVNYKKALMENVAMLIDKDTTDYKTLLNLPA